LFHIMHYIMCSIRKKNRNCDSIWNPKFENLPICLSYIYIYNLIFFGTTRHCLWVDFPTKTIQDCYARDINNTGTCSLCFFLLILFFVLETSCKCFCFDVFKTKNMFYLSLNKNPQFFIHVYIVSENSNRNQLGTILSDLYWTSAKSRI